MRFRITPQIILDTVFILAYSIGYVSLLKYVTYAIFPVPESIQLFVFLSLIYLIRFGGRSIKGKAVSGSLVFFLIGLYLWEIFQGILVGGDVNAVLVTVANLLSTYVAYKYMSNIINSKGSINSILNSYTAYMYYTVFVVIISSFLILSQVMSPYSNPQTANSLFRSNMEFSNVTYYFPGHLSVVYETGSLFLFMFGFPSLSGLSHESQAMFFTIYPALFLVFYTKSKKNIERTILLIFLVTIVLTTSLTAAICFILTYFLHLLWMLRIKGQSQSAMVIIFLICIFGVMVASSQFGGIINEFVLGKAKFDTVGSSGSDSLSLIRYVFTPFGFLGQGIYGSTAEQAMQQYSMNCGYVSSLMIIAFLVLFIITSLRCVFSKELLCHAIGLASFYFIAHSFKYGIQLFNSNYLFFMVFLLSYAGIVRENNVFRSRSLNGEEINEVSPQR